VDSRGIVIAGEAVVEDVTGEGIEVDMEVIEAIEETTVVGEVAEGDLAAGAVIEDVDVDLHHIARCQEADLARKALHVVDVGVAVEDLDLVPDLNEATIDNHKVNGSQKRLLIEKKLYLNHILQILPCCTCLLDV